MTIVIEEEPFSSSITSLSTLSPQTNYQTIMEREANNLNNNNSSSYFSTSSSVSLNSNASSSTSPNLVVNNSSSNNNCNTNNNTTNNTNNASAVTNGDVNNDEKYCYAVFIFRPNSGNFPNGNGTASNGGANTSSSGSSGVLNTSCTNNNTTTNNTSSSNFNVNNGEVFEERRILLDKPCKIGRSVAKLRPELNNAIFDCKVLSRNHALLWEENSKVEFPFFE